MRSFNGFSLAIIGLAMLVLSGCQSGKLAMPKLAFWKNDAESLDDDYIEPPSHQFSPAKDEDSALAATDDISEPPLKPTGKGSLDSFEEDLAETYKQLQAQRTTPKTSPLSSSSNANRPDPTKGYASNTPTKPKYGSAPPYSGFQTKTPSSTSNNSTFSPGTSSYEKIAKQSFAPGNPSKLSPLTPRSGTATTTGTVTTMNPQQDPAKRIQNPYLQTPIADPIGTKPDNSVDAPASYEQYPSTPYKPFQPRNTSTPDSGAQTTPQPTKQSPVSNVGLPPSLTRGQGTYAPGSVKAPQPFQPNQVTVPKETGSDSNLGYGGGFQPK